jgi:hypothetical protein
MTSDLSFRRERAALVGAYAQRFSVPAEGAFLMGLYDSILRKRTP